MSRIIALVDANSFFASCHQAVNPELQDKAVIVAGDPQKRTGIVLAASYPAKALGVKTGLPLWEARRLCPHGYYFKPDYPLYVSTSARILGIMRDFTDLVEPFSIDEAFLDLTGVTRLFGSPAAIAARLQERIRSEVGIPCSVGLGPNKLIAKMAADLQKPNGLTILENRKDFQRIFWPRPVRDLFGVGPRYEKHFRRLGITTIGDLANCPVQMLKKRWGKNGELLWHSANGTDQSPVVPTSLDTLKSIGHQKTLPRDLRGYAKIEMIILELSEIVARRVRRGGYIGRTVFLTLRDTELRFLTRSASLPPTDLARDIRLTAVRLLHRHWDETWPVRLVGVTLGGLQPKDYEQYDLFGEKERQIKLATACDQIWERFGPDAIFRGVSLMEDSLHGQQ